MVTETYELTGGDESSGDEDEAERQVRQDGRDTQMTHCSSNTLSMCLIHPSRLISSELN